MCDRFEERRMFGFAYNIVRRGIRRGDGGGAHADNFREDILCGLDELGALANQLVRSLRER